MQNVFICNFASNSFQVQQSKQLTAWLELGVDAKNVYQLSPSDLPKDFNADFPSANETNRFGWFSFKPSLLLVMLSKMADGDILIYLDVNDRPLLGILEYVKSVMLAPESPGILACGTHYVNSKHQSRFHIQNWRVELRAASGLCVQPEAGALAIKNSKDVRSLVKLWYEMTLLQARSIEKVGNQESSRHDQETLFLLSRMYRTIKIESWYMYKLFGKESLRKYIDWECFR